MPNISYHLYPVVLSIDERQVKELSGAQKVNFLRKTTRQALKLSAEKSNLILGPLEKDEKGAPIPVDGIYWSLSHKTACVAAVVSKHIVGIDVEELNPRNSSILFDYTATKQEWALCAPSPNWEFFYRFWTAKEAAIKATGQGLKDLKKCKIIAIPDENHIMLEYQDNLWAIEQFRYKNHIISLTTQNDTIVWSADPP